jgi:hypothetical protein
MIKYLRHDEINFKRWDKCIDRAINSYVYAYSWYLNITAGEWDALVEDDYTRVFPLPFRQKYGVKYIYQPIFCQQLGLFSTTLQAYSKLTEFINAIPKHFRVMEINLNKYYNIQQDKNYTLVQNVNLELDLASDYQKLRSKYSENLKRNLKKAASNQLNIVQTLKPEQLITLFKENKGSELKVYSDEDYFRLNRLMYMLIYKKKANLVGVISAENNLLAAALFLYDQYRHIFLFSGLSAEGKESGAMPFLIDQYIQKYSNSKMIFDFEGSNNLPLARFYAGFGALEYNYYGLRIYHLPFPLKHVFSLYKSRKTRSQKVTTSRNV